LIEYTALLTEYTAVLTEYRAVLIGFDAVAAVLDVFRTDHNDGPLLQVSLHKMQGSFDRVYGFFDNFLQSTGLCG